jgi:hypothetical protein
MAKEGGVHRIPAAKRNSESVVIACTNWRKKSKDLKRPSLIAAMHQNYLGFDVTFCDRLGISFVGGTVFRDID